MNENLHLVKQGLIVKPETRHESSRMDHHATTAESHLVWNVALGPIENHEPSEQAMVNLEQLSHHLISLNEFLAEHDLPPFRLAELPLNQEVGMALLSPHDMMVLQQPDAEGVMRTYHCPRIMPEILTARGIEHGREIPYVQSLDDQLMVVHFPMTPGPPEFGEMPQELIMSMFMEKNSAPKKEPLCLVAPLSELEPLAEKAPTFEPIKLTQQQFDKLTAHYATLEKQFGGKTVPLSPTLIAENSNVTSVQDISVASKFHRTLSFTMTDGTIRHRLVNRGEMVAGKDHLQEAACFVITTPINGEEHVVVAKMHRLNGQANGYEETAYELPRGFSVKALDKPQFRHELHVAEAESGLSASTLAAHQTNGAEKLSSDPTLEDVEADVVMISLPANVDFQLAAKQDEEPTKPIEQLVPSWMSMKDAIQAVKTGEVFTEAFSVAMLATWLFRQGVLELPVQLPSGEQTAELGIVMEKVQNWRTGGEKLTLWRGDSQQFQPIAGPLNPNDGINRRFHTIGFGSNTSVTETLNSSTKAWDVVSLTEFVRGISELRWDNVTISAGLKMLLQKEWLIINYDKLKTAQNS